MTAGAPFTLLPSTYGHSVLEPALKKAAAARLMERIWAKDATLWTQDPAQQAHIARRLGWLTILNVMQQRVGEIQAFAQEIRQAGFTHALLFGMGGSSLFSEVCRHTFGTGPGWLDLTVMDTTDANAVAQAKQRVPLDKTLFIVSSKSGGTTESNALCDYFYDVIRQTRGDQAGQQFIAISDAGTSLEALARERKFRRAFIHGPGTGQEVGGRFSGVTYFGMVPAALQGVDVGRLIASGQAMLKASAASVPAAQNPALQLGLTLAESYTRGRDKMTLLSAKPLSTFGVWVEQLIAESLGKSGHGVIPVDNEPLKPVVNYPNDRVFIDLQVASQPDTALAKYAEALAQAGHPVIRLHLADRYDLGAEVMRWFLATAVAAAWVPVNAFDEPNVQESKDRTKALLEHFVKHGRLPEDQPAFSDGEIAAFGTVVKGTTLEEALQGLLATRKPGDYLAICSFLPRSAKLDAAVKQLHEELSRRLDTAVTLGFGPRYLHSTGQLHKGGPDKVVLLFLTSNDPVDVPIAGKPYGFDVLKRAQALGDLQALQERKRRLLRLDFGGAPDAGVERLRHAVEKTVPPAPAMGAKLSTSSR
jgi:glucose-6-phosphate isomerase